MPEIWAFEACLKTLLMLLMLLNIDNIDTEHGHIDGMPDVRFNRIKVWFQEDRK